jgi:hypothetical protein
MRNGVMKSGAMIHASIRAVIISRPDAFTSSRLAELRNRPPDRQARFFALAVFWQFF